ncbi:MAG: hypothetical protein PHI06_14755, partial [Desulfobulbaceae bacterium]|nr:hypothetical protein [Desulfobulbaceae bacterium]
KSMVIGVSQMTSLDAVRLFWENNPLWMGESSFGPGSNSFFEKHLITLPAVLTLTRPTGQIMLGWVVSIFGPEELQCVDWQI